MHPNIKEYLSIVLWHLLRCAVIWVVMVWSLSLLGCAGQKETIRGTSQPGNGEGNETYGKVPEWADVGEGHVGVVVGEDYTFSPAYFDYDVSRFTRDEDTQTVFDHSMALLSPSFEGDVMIVEGHCDERGTIEYNLALGMRRADYVARMLKSYGVPSSRILTVSYGKERPAVARHDEAAWAKNRRCEFRTGGK